MMLGVLIWLWAVPVMTVGHLVFSLGMTAYIVIGVALEERGLVANLGAPYEAYRRRVRAFFPFPRG
jgi:protein-S-isoprenylcysteine O-methyltransferase Ste14